MSDRFECVKKFDVESGKLSRAAEVMLTKRRVTRIPGQNGTYLYACEVEAETIGDAGIVSRDLLLELLKPYGVEIVVTDSSVRRLPAMDENKVVLMRQYTIYRGGADLPRGYAIREVLIGPGTVEVGELLASGLRCLADARDAVPPEADHCIHASEEDDPTIVETWV